MENNTIEMELNNEEVMTNDVTDDVVDTELNEDADAVIIADIEPEDDGNPFAALLGVLLIGGAGFGLLALARRKELKEKRWERLQRKMEKEAAKRGIEVSYTEITVEEASEEVDSEEVEFEEDNKD